MKSEAFCCVVCGSKRGKNVSLFRFPKDLEVRKSWAEFCGVEIDDINSRHRLCEKHFNKEDKGSRCLRKYAVPSIQTEHRNLQTHFSSSSSTLKNKSIKKKCCLCRRNRGDNVSLFNFPKDFVLRNLWAEFCQKDPDNLFASDRLCSGHFVKDNFCNNLSTAGSRKRLKQGAVPTVFLAPKESASEVPLRTKRRRCFICGYKTSEESPLFRIPKEKNVRQAWEEFCRVSHIPPRAALCGRHFTESDIMYDNRQYGGKIKLKKTAVPSRFLKGTRRKTGYAVGQVEEMNGFEKNSISPGFIGIASDDMMTHWPDFEFLATNSENGEFEYSLDDSPENDSDDGEIEHSPDSKYQDNVSDDMGIEHSPDSEFQENSSGDGLVKDLLTSEFIKHTFVEVVLEDSPRSEYNNENTCDDIVKQEPLTSEIIENTSNHMLVPDTLTSVPETPEEDLVPKRRYVGDFQRSDMKDPRLADQFFTSAKAEIARKTKALKGERTKNRRLTMKIDSLIGVIEKLKCKELLPENHCNFDDTEKSK